MVVKPKIDQGLLEPGWGGEIAPDELDFLQTELTKDKKLAFRWGFQPAKKRRPMSDAQVLEWWRWAPPQGAPIRKDADAFLATQ